MLKSAMLCLVAVAACQAQNPKPAPASPQKPTTAPSSKPPAAAPAPEQKPEAATAQVAPNQPVITIQGLCTGGAKPPCTTTITRQQFDHMVASLNPNNQALPPAMRRNLAHAYIDLLIWADAGEKAKVDQGPTYQEVMRVLRLKTISDLYHRQLEDEYRQPSDAEISAYYEAHKQEYESVKLRRVYIPKLDPSGKSNSPADREAFDKKAQEAATALVNRTAQGEDPDKLQKEVYSTLGITLPPPNTDLGQVRHGSVSPELNKEIFALKDGGVYKATEPANYAIYKVESRATLSLDSVKEEVKQALFRQKMDAKNREVEAAVHSDLNDAYFGPANPPAPLPGPPRPARPDR